VKLDPHQGVIFLDRDGTLIHDPGYISDPDKVLLLPNTFEGLEKLSNMGWKFVMVSNQSGIGRGYYETRNYESVNHRMLELLGPVSEDFLLKLHCPHTPDDSCACRKPKTGMYEQAQRELGINFTSSVMIGNAESDFEAGLRIGALSILIGEPGSDSPADQRLVAPDLLTASHIIERII